MAKPHLINIYNIMQFVKKNNTKCDFSKNI